MKIETKRSNKDRRLAALAREFRAGRLVLADYLEQAYRAILDGMREIT